MKNQRGTFLTAILLACCILGMAGQVYAQTSFGGVNGTVSDQSGAVVPDVAVRLVNRATNIESRTATNASGYFVFSNLRPGTYVLAVEHTGFKTVHLDAFTVGVNQVVTQNLSLSVGAVTEAVQVTGASELIQAASSELGNIIEEKVVKALPLNGRNFTQLLILTPGVNPVSTAQGSQSTMNFGAAEGNTGLPGSTLANASVQGQQNRSKIYYVDGIINTSVRGTSYVVLPDIDSLEEFKVQSHNDKAEYGGVTGGVVNISTKTGSNNFHGSAFWFLRNDYFDARNPFSDAARERPLPFRQNQFGANVGGPIRRNKTFFFASYDGWRYRDVNSSRIYVPTSRELGGDFSQARNGRDIFNPYTTRTVNGKLVRDIFPHRTIPANLIYKPTQGFFQTYGITPNLPGDPQYNFQQERARRNDANGMQFRVDHVFRTSDNVFFRWNEQYVSTYNPQGDKGYKTPDATNRNYGGGWLHSFTSRLILEVRGGVATQPTEDAPLEHPEGAGPLTQLGFKDVDKYGGVAITMQGSPWSGAQYGVQGPRPRGNPNWNLSGNLMWQRGNHSFKTGLQFVHIRRLQRNQFEEIFFNEQATVDPQKSGTGDNFASALLGIPSQARAYVHEFGSIVFGTGTWSGFFQDEWKMRRNVTLTFGLRYDYVGRVKGEGLQSGPDLSSGNWLIADRKLPPPCGAGVAPPCMPSPLDTIPFNQFIKLTGDRYSIIKPIKDNWGPRVGVAWQINPKTVIRAGYSLMWDALPSRSQYGQHQFESWGWPQASGFDTATINRPQDPLQRLDALELPFAQPRAYPWNSTGYFNDPNRKDAYSQQWHVEIQREFTRNLMMAIGYVGSRNGRLEYAGNAFAATKPGANASGGRLSASEVNALRPWPHVTGTFTYENDIGYSNYNSLQYKLQRRFSAGLTTLFSYTWQKSIDTASGWFNAENGFGGSNMQNYHDIDSNRAVSSYDVPHLLTWATVWELPAGKSKRWLNSGPAAAIFGNWQMNWLLMARSGQPFTPFVGGDIANIGSTATYGRPHLVGDPLKAGPVSANPAAGCQTTISQGGLAADAVLTQRTWYNPCAFMTPVSTRAEFGSAGRNILRVDNVWNADFGLQKNIPFGEVKQLQMRFEAFNLFNHMDLGTPSTRTDQTTPGRITSISHQPRQLQFGLRFVF